MDGLIESAALQTAEAPLTGGSLPMTKDIAAIAEDVPLGDRNNMVYSGTAATYGHGKAVVTATGMHTEMGRIAGLLEATPDETTPLQRELDRTGKLLGLGVIAIAVIMIVIIVVVEDVRGISALFGVLILGVALAVAAVPEGLPAVVTTVLSIGVRRARTRARGRRPREQRLDPADRRPVDGPGRSHRGCAAGCRAEGRTERGSAHHAIPTCRGGPLLLRAQVDEHDASRYLAGRSGSDLHEGRARRSADAVHPG